MQVCETPNDEDARYPSLPRVALKFCVPHSWKGVKINHEAPEGHKEFAREAGATLCHTIVTWQLSRFSLWLRTVEFGL